MMGLVFGVWFGFFRFDLSSCNFSFHFPPCCAGHPCVGFVQKFCFGMPLQREGAETREPCTAQELPSQQNPPGLCTGCALGCAQVVPWELRVPCKGWGEQEVWGAEQSWCFGSTGLVLCSCFCAWSEANRLSLSGAVGEACQAHSAQPWCQPGTPGCAVQRSLPSWSQCHPRCTCHCCPCRLSLCLTAALEGR